MFIPLHDRELLSVGFLMVRARLLSIPMLHLSRLDPSLSHPGLLLRLLLHASQLGTGLHEILRVDLGLHIEVVAVLSDHNQGLKDEFLKRG